jgi:hypothetical protein
MTIWKGGVSVSAQNKKLEKLLDQIIEKQTFYRMMESSSSL